jgi:hypothetical protein
MSPTCNRDLLHATAFVPGPLDGFIVNVEPTRIAGWVMDFDHPDIPVALDIWCQDRLVWLGSRKLGRVIAQDQADKGFGFEFVPEAPIPADLLDTIRVRRAVDGAELRRSTALSARVVLAQA